MGIGSMRGIDNISGRQAGAQPADAVSKNIQKEISDVQRQKQELSSKRDLPFAEKEKERQELQQKMSGLNRELRQRQAQNRREEQIKKLTDENGSQISGTKDDSNENAKAEKITAQDKAEGGTKSGGAKNAGRADAQNSEISNKTRSAGSPAQKTEDKAASNPKTQDKNSQGGDSQNRTSQLQDFEISQKEWKAVAASKSSREQMRKQETVIARIEGGIAILKSEIKLDEARGADVRKKQEELEKQEDRLQRAAAASFSNPGPLNQAAEKTAADKPGEATNLAKEKEPEAQQPLFKDVTVSFMS